MPDGSSVSEEGDARVRRGVLVRRAIGFFAVLAVVWMIFYSIFEAVPYIRPGSDLVYNAKVAVALHGDPFPDPQSQDKVRVAIFGNSMILTGFLPELFDSLSGQQTYSYNMGLPNSVYFVNELAAMAERGDAPDLALLTVPWPKEPPPDWWDHFMDDEWIRGELFPFHELPRDVTLFVIRARPKGGILAAYQAAKEDIDKTLVQRGYYFIEGQSHFPGHRLPEDFRMPSDDPNVVLPRNVHTEGPVFDRLLALAKKYDIQLCFVPYYLRTHHAATPAGRNEKTVRKLAPYPEFRVIGPDYFSFPNRFFSDHVHLNPEGADVYTRKLWELLEPVVNDSAKEKKDKRVTSMGRNPSYDDTNS